MVSHHCGCLWVDDFTETTVWRGQQTKPLLCLYPPVDNHQIKNKLNKRIIKSLTLLLAYSCHHIYIWIRLADNYPQKVDRATKLLLS